jgi:hypothetical protein
LSQDLRYEADKERVKNTLIAVYLQYRGALTPGQLEITLGVFFYEKDKQPDKNLFPAISPQITAHTNSSLCPLSFVHLLIP